MGNITTLGKQHHQAPNLGVRARLGPIMHEMPDSHKNGWIPSQAFHSDKRTNSKIPDRFQQLTRKKHGFSGWYSIAYPVGPVHVVQMFYAPGRSYNELLTVPTWTL